MNALESTSLATLPEAVGKSYDQVKWELRTASIGNDKGAVIFEQRDVEAPADWSQTATNIVVSKYFYGKAGSPERGVERPAIDQPRSRYHHRLGHHRPLLPHRGRCREFP